MHAYEYGRACSHIRRVAKVYVVHASIQTSEGNEDRVCQYGEIANKVQDEVATRTMNEEIVDDVDVYNLVVDDEESNDNEVIDGFVNNADVNDEAKCGGVNDETKANVQRFNELMQISLTKIMQLKMIMISYMKQQ